MRSFIASATIFAATVAAGSSKTVFVGDGTVPLIYAAEPFPDSIYNGTQYNQTEIRGITYNSSNEWPCLTSKQYTSILPACAANCVAIALAADDCDVDDFLCHCTASQSAILDSTIIPCLTSGDNALCTGEEIGELANYVHGSLCPYFIDVPSAYDHCKAPIGYSSSAGPKATSSAGGDYWPIPSSSSSTKKASTTSSVDYWPTEASSSSVKKTSSSAKGWSCETSTSTSTTSTTYETWCSEATTLTWGSETSVITEAATVTITNWPVEVTSVWTVTYDATWSTDAWAVPASTASAAAWVYSAVAAPVSTATGTAAWAGAATGTGAWSATAAAQFTGAASANKVAGAMAGVAAVAALLI